MRAVVTPGGSLTGALALLAIAWGVRAVRSARLRQAHAAGSAPQRYTDFGRFHAAVSLEAAALLIETSPVPHCVLHVVSSAPQAAPRANGGGSDAAATAAATTAAAASATPPTTAPTSLLLPQPLRAAAIAVPEADLGVVLTQPAAWHALAGAAAAQRPPPTADHVLLLIADDEATALQAAGRAASLGFPRTLVLRSGGGGGVAAGGTQPQPQQQPPTPVLHRDALALLLGRVPGAPVPRGVTVLDVRRYDERALYGGIAGAHHLPADELASALALPAPAFAARYSFAKPVRGDVLVLQCRTNRRAFWGAQLARDAGWRRVHVYGDGAYGWRFDPAVLPYAAYEQWQAPPEPEPFAPDAAPDAAAAVAELRRLGLLGVGPAASGVAAVAAS